MDAQNLYYYDELQKVFSNGKTEYAPNFKIFANGNGHDTKHISLNEVSAPILIEWLKANFITDQKAQS